MSSFTESIEHLKLSPVGDGKTWIVRTPFQFYWDNPTTNKREYIIVDEDFHTDFATVPQIFWSILPPWGKYGKAAILHDRLYRYKDYTRKECDIIMKEAMYVLGVKKWKINVIYWSLFTFGFTGWYRLGTKDGWKYMLNNQFKK